VEYLVLVEKVMKEFKKKQTKNPRQNNICKQLHECISKAYIWSSGMHVSNSDFGIIVLNSICSLFSITKPYRIRTPANSSFESISGTLIVFNSLNYLLFIVHNKGTILNDWFIQRLAPN